MALPKLLVVEDDEALRIQLKYALQGDFALAFAEDRFQALAAAAADVKPLVVLLDLGLPPSPNTADEGLKTLEELLQVAPRMKIVILAGNTERLNAFRAVQLGACDYHLKPLEIDMYTEGHKAPPGTRKLPLNLLDAIRLVDGSKLLRKELGAEFVDSYVKLKTREWNDYSRHLTEWERLNTLDC